MDKTLISIIVPVYNIEKYLRKCIDSLINQTYHHIEIILVDDGSTDSSGIICDDYAKKDNRVEVLHKKNDGVAKARLSGFELSCGDYVTFIDGDDYISNYYIEKLLEPIIKYNVDLVCCKHNNQHGDKTYPSKYTIEGLFMKSEIDSFISSEYLYSDKLGYSGIPIFLVTKLIRRKYVLNGLLAGKGLWWGEDQIASFKILTDINSMYVLNECMYYYVKHEGQATSLYSTSLWTNQLNVYMRYKLIDKNNLLQLQLTKHVWKFSFLVNLYRKMPLKIHSYSDFSKELKIIEKQDGWKDFFKGKTSGLGCKNDIKYWLLKLKLYHLFYICYLKKIYE